MPNLDIKGDQKPAQILKGAVHESHVHQSIFGTPESFKNLSLQEFSPHPEIFRVQGTTTSSPIWVDGCQTWWELPSNQNLPSEFTFTQDHYSALKVSRVSQWPNPASPIWVVGCQKKCHKKCNMMVPSKISWKTTQNITFWTLNFLISMALSHAKWILRET